MIRLLLTVKEFFSNLLSSFGTCIKVLLLSRFFTKLHKIKPVNRKAIILANGPSLKNLNLKDNNYNDYDFFSVNHSPSSALFNELQPKYHVINAPELWRSDVSEYYKSASDTLFGQLYEIVTWQLVLFIPYDAKKYTRWRSIISNNEFIKICYFNPTPVEGIEWLNHLFFKWNLGMPRPHNVLIPSLMISMSLKYNEVFILGADHSWLKEIYVTDNNVALISLKHFYDEKKVTAHTMTKVGKGSRTLHEMLHKLYLTFKGYFIINKYAKKMKIRIYNSTKGSYIDAFERKYI